MDEGIHTLATNETKLDKTAFNKIASLDNFDLRRKDLNRHSVMGTEVTYCDFTCADTESGTRRYQVTLIMIRTDCLYI